jgi:hypothetical protein
MTLPTIACALRRVGRRRRASTRLLTPARQVPVVIERIGEPSRRCVIIAVVSTVD